MRKRVFSMEFAKCVEIIQSFLEYRISVEMFEKSFLETFKTDLSTLSPDAFEILNSLFESVDAYDADCSVGEETAFLISEAQLRKDAKIALQKLETLDI